MQRNVLRFATSIQDISFDFCNLILITSYVENLISNEEKYINIKLQRNNKMNNKAVSLHAM
jgi:hypothetical protein